MKRGGRLKRGKPLKRTPITRHTRLRAKGGSMFKLTDDDKAQWDWMGERAPQPCDVCSYPTFGRCHVIARSRGGRVLDNIVWLCEDRLDLDGCIQAGCHCQQEKRTEKYEAETDVDLYAKAAAHTTQWRKET